MGKLLPNILYKSQNDPDAKIFVNDCGPTCVAMIANGLGRNVTTDEIYKASGAPANKYVSIYQMMNAGKTFDTPFEYFYYEDMKYLKGLIDEGLTPIVLVHYASWSQLPDNRTQSSFRGPHFVVVVGYDDEYIYVNDPLFWGSRRSEGEHKRWTHAEFDLAWASAHKDGNRDRSGIACVIPTTVEEFPKSRFTQWNNWLKDRPRPHMK